MSVGAAPVTPGGKQSGFWVGAGAAALAAGLAHATSLAAPFFADDWLFLDQVRSRSLLAVLASPDPLGNFFRPLGRQLWFWLWASISGESPVVFHAANVALLMASVVLLALLVRRVSGATAGVVAAGFLALNYAADVPVYWASGSQELLALTLSLSALLAHVSRRRVTAAALFVAALLSKESVVLLPLAAAALDLDGGGVRARARRLLPLVLALLAWAGLAAWATLRRGAPGAGLAPSTMGPLAVPVLLVRVTLGLEWPTGAGVAWRPTDPGGLIWVALLLVVAGAWFVAPRVARVASAARGARKARRGRDKVAATNPAPEPVPEVSSRGIRAGLVWAVAGALPVAVVAPLWSAYYLLFALAGVGLALGTWVARSRRPGMTAVVALAVLGWLSSQARALQEFATAPSPWSAQSHVNRFYLDRGMVVVARAVADLRSELPAPAPRTSFFFAGLPSFAAVQVADGPLVRGVYRDSSLRGFFLSEMTRERLARGPWRVFFFDPPSGHLRDNTNKPGVFMSTALGAILNGKPESADIALEAARLNGEQKLGLEYVSAWVAFELGDTARTRAQLLHSGHGVGGDTRVIVDTARRQLARTDSLGALITLREGLRTNSFDPNVHAVLSDILLERPESRPEGQLEAYATRLLAPRVGSVWRRWAYVLAYELRIRESIAALDRYAELDPVAWAADSRATRMRATMVRMLPGGDLAQRAMKRELTR